VQINHLAQSYPIKTKGHSETTGPIAHQTVGAVKVPDILPRTIRDVVGAVQHRPIEPSRAELWRQWVERAFREIRATGGRRRLHRPIGPQLEDRV
jgi:hypothetical protein